MLSDIILFKYFAIGYRVVLLEETIILSGQLFLWIFGRPFFLFIFFKLILWRFQDVLKFFSIKICMS